MGFSPLWKQLFVLLGAALNLLGNGSIHGYPAVLLEQLQASQEIPFDKHQSSTFASILGFSGLVGCLIAPLLMNRFGRRPAHICSTLPVTIGWLMAAFAPNITVLTISRLFHGLGLGLRTPIAGILIAEYSDPKYRGAFLGTFAICISLGVLISHLIGSFISWRMTALVLTLIPLSSMTIIFFSPESPSWLAAKGDFKKCRQTFQWLRGDDEKNNLELDELIHSQTKTVKNDFKFWSAFKFKYFYLPAFITFNLEVMYEFGGGHVMPAYTHIILTSILNKSNVALEITILDALRVISTVLAVFFIKRWNRKLILLIGCTMTITTLTLISIYTYLRKFSIIPDCRELAMLLFVVYTIAFCLCVMPLSHIAIAELFPLKFRSFGSTFTTLTLTPSFMISLKTAPYLFQAVGVEGSYLIYAAILTVSLIFVMILMPETKDRTLQEIETHFKGRLVYRNDVEMKLIANDKNAK